MNIDEIRAEIPKAFGSSFPAQCDWIRDHGKPDFDENKCYGFVTNQTAARILVDMAYKAGKAEINLTATDTKLAENWHEGYKRGYNDAAKNHKAWYVLDKHGERAHIGDKAKTDDCNIPFHIIGFSRDETGKMEIIDSDGFPVSADTCEKVTPDTREKIKEDLTHHLCYHSETYLDRDSSDDLAEQFISRIEALEE